MSKSNPKRIRLLYTADQYKGLNLNVMPIDSIYDNISSLCDPLNVANPTSWEKALVVVVHSKIHIKV